MLFGAIILGITIHFFIASNKSLKATAGELEKNGLAQDEWKLRYFNDMELRDKEISTLKQQILEAEENANIYSIEAEEMHRQNRKLEAEIGNLKKILAEEPPHHHRSQRKESSRNDGEITSNSCARRKAA